MRKFLLFGIALALFGSACRKDNPKTTPQNSTPEPVSREPSVELQEIQKLLDARQYEAALSKIDKTLTAHPKHEKLIFMRGFALFNLQRYEDALAVFETLRTQGVLTLELVVALSETLFYLKRLEDCEKILREGMAKFPKAAPLWYNLGGIYAETGDWEQASKMYGEALLRQPDFAPALLSVGDIAYRQGNLSQARAHFEKLSRIPNYDVMALLKLAVVDMKEKKWDAARERLNSVRAKDPQNPELARIETALDAARLFDEFSGYLNVKQCLKAKATFQQIQERHSQHPLLPKAMDAFKKACPQ